MKRDYSKDKQVALSESNSVKKNKEIEDQTVLISWQQTLFVRTQYDFRMDIFGDTWQHF